jgi:TRAP-type C4-dicarboxylate transport system permease large subunit
MRRCGDDRRAASGVIAASGMRAQIIPPSPALIVTTGVTSGQIYLGAAPFVVIKCIMLGLVIAIPVMAMNYKRTGSQADRTKIKIDIRKSICPRRSTRPSRRRDRDSARGIALVFRRCRRRVFRWFQAPE